MIRNSELLRELDLRHERRVLETLSFQDALSRFEALWHEARLLNPKIGEDWRADLAPDLAVARALNGLPPAP